MTVREGRALRILVLTAVVGALVLPIMAGLFETARAAFGYLPVVGADHLSLAPWRRLADLPGLRASIILTLWTGFAATILSLFMAFALAGRVWMHSGGKRLRALALPLLAAPHAAMAIGLAFLIAPSGWIARVISPWATGWQVPPGIATVHDPGGIALILGLIVKEVPFLLLMILSVLAQIKAREQAAAARALGYSPQTVWTKILVPQIYRLIRLPVFATLAFALSVVDMALILGPTQPPTLAVAMTRWFVAADTRLLMPASAAAILLAALAMLSVALWILGERVMGALNRRRIVGGARRGWPIAVGAATGQVLLWLGTAALIALLVWSLAWRWSFPNGLPESWSVTAWMRGGWWIALKQSLFLGTVTVLVSVTLSVLWLEGETRAGLARARWASALIYLPLMVPQAAFLFGLSVAFLRGGIGAGHFAVMWGQALFVYPYVMLALSDPWHALDRRLDRTAASLGAGPWRRLFRVKLPILLRPILTAAAIGFAVSVAQYLPTLLLGAGRVTTLTTEAVTLASGSDRRVTGVFAVLLAAMPLVGFGLAFAIPALFYRNRRGLSGGRA
ncbi:MAG: ABC transporter permease subunit [Rhodobacteraceae bacterium]|nr:ABC transporter permease subunit [Paracoccaceae bacterium]